MFDFFRKKNRFSFAESEIVKQCLKAINISEKEIDQLLSSKIKREFDRELNIDDLGQIKVTENEEFLLYLTAYLVIDNKEIKVEFYSKDKRLKIIYFSAAFSKIDKLKDKIQIINTILWTEHPEFDPSFFIIQKIDSSFDPEFKLPNLISDLTEVQFFAPCEIKAVEFLIKQIESVLPNEYLDLLKISNGLQSKELEIYSSKDIFKFCDKLDDYYAIIDIKSVGTVCVKEFEKNSKIYFVSYEGYELIELTEGLFNFIGNKIKSYKDS